MTYAVINAPFLLLATVLVVTASMMIRRRHAGAGRRMGIGVLVAFAGVIALTAVFDNVIILTGVVDYDHSLTSGIRVGVAPLEDFAYAIVAAVALPALWHLIPARPPRSHREDGA